MNLYKIKSPKGTIITVGADSIYHAIQKAFARDDYKYERQEYFYLNDDQVKSYEAKIKRYKK